MNEQVLTVEDVINMAANELKMVRVPSELTEEIGLPVYRALRDLQLLQQKFAEDKANAQKEKAKAEKDEPEFEIVPAEEVPEGVEVV